MSTSEESTENSMAQVLKALQVLTVRIDGMNQQLGDVATRLTVVERRPALESAGILQSPGLIADAQTHLNLRRRDVSDVVSNIVGAKFESPGDGWMCRDGAALGFM
ncbi:hypothetical protein Droror1_Dr00010311 [Drosera rotundifolia]